MNSRLKSKRNGFKAANNLEKEGNVIEERDAQNVELSSKARGLMMG